MVCSLDLCICVGINRDLDNHQFFHSCVEYSLNARNCVSEALSALGQSIMEEAVVRCYEQNLNKCIQMQINA